jgi:uncharacterized low-complexity protein
VKKETLTSLIAATFALIISDVAKSEESATPEPSSIQPQQSKKTDLLKTQHHECGGETCASDSGDTKKTAPTPGGSSGKIVDKTP